MSSLVPTTSKKIKARAIGFSFPLSDSDAYF